YPLDALPLEEGKEYAWQVEALDELGRPITSGRRSSEIWVFRYGAEEAEDEPRIAEGALPDPLTLVPGVARLTDLGGADVRETDFGYQIDGRLTLEIFGPFEAETEVEAEGLQVDGATLEEGQDGPEFVAGRVSGRLDAEAVPESQRGPFVELTDVEFTPGTLLTLGGSLTLPGAPEREMEGRVRVGLGGLGG
ncbi:MAG: hypothetical protein GWM92_10070, partial [Gemmatimonadetes bacterium]|nr:hypothetical protein [Gemmatimonadota bacterium]NIR79020.1 hypothetical protein [Gemmatimonadota bacterium]NIT87667.1 hypothetical protein [Gemmatimonadota bacterium]NIU33401.1 hypothetical protein [Gemmatimonadota bacterium]NIU36190.1 hypothetical protein [Gemmatimonadota bacterium]